MNEPKHKTALYSVAVYMWCLYIVIFLKQNNIIEISWVGAILAPILFAITILFAIFFILATLALIYNFFYKKHDDEFPPQ